MPASEKLRRVDVLSLKGGAGKTTLSYLLAKHQAATSKKPVLLLDADFTGTCVGELLQPPGNWETRPNLAHLVSAEPETLVDWLKVGELPVYLLEPKESEPKRLGELIEEDKKKKEKKTTRKLGGEVLFCPSHAFSDRVESSSGDLEMTATELVVLHGLISNEIAGGWVHHVIERIIDASQRALKGTEYPLGGVVVDHGPGMAGVQGAALEQIATAFLEQKPKKPSNRRGLLVFTADFVDLKAMSLFWPSASKRFKDQGDQAHKFVVGCVNNAPTPTKPEWREGIDSLKKGITGAKWLKRPEPGDDPEAFEIPELSSIREANLSSALADTDIDLAVFEELRKALFEGPL